MMISTKGRYALRVMIDLAQQKKKAYVPLDEIATRQGISKKYLEIILKTLVTQRLLTGQRGKGGGYRLTRTPKEYQILEILELTEGPLSTVSCLQPGAVPCERTEICITLPMWKLFDQMVRDFFSGITLQDLIDGNLSKKASPLESPVKDLDPLPEEALDSPPSQP